MDNNDLQKGLSLSNEIKQLENEIAMLGNLRHIYCGNFELHFDTDTNSCGNQHGFIALTDEEFEAFKLDIIANRKDRLAKLYTEFKLL